MTVRPIPDALLAQLRSFSDDDMFEADPERVDALRDDLAEHPFEGLALACPARLEDARFPVLLFSVQRTSRLARVSPYLDYVFVASPIGRGTTAVTPYRSRKPVEKNPRPRPPRDEPKVPVEGEGEASIASLSVVDVGQRVTLSETGRVAVRVIAWDERSNTAITELDRAEEDGPVDERYFLDDARALNEAVADARDAYARAADSPDVDGTGAALSLPPRWEPTARNFVVRGAVKVALDAGARIEPRYRDGRMRDDDGPRPGHELLPRAILTGAFLLVRRGHPTPAKIEVIIPLYGEAPLAAGAPVTAWFAIDLVHAFTPRPEPDTYMAYFVLGEHTAGPYEIVVT